MQSLVRFLKIRFDLHSAPNHRLPSSAILYVRALILPRPCFLLATYDIGS